MGVAPQEAEIIELMAAILGWQVEVEQRDVALEHQPGGPFGVFAADAEARAPCSAEPVTAAARDRNDIVPACAVVMPVAMPVAVPLAVPVTQRAGRATVSPRLVLRQGSGLIAVEADTAGLAAQLARLGLDRLVLPLSLHALEELLAFAG